VSSKIITPYLLSLFFSHALQVGFAVPFMLKVQYFLFRTVDSGVYFLTAMEYAEENWSPGHRSDG